MQDGTVSLAQGASLRHDFKAGSWVQMDLYLELPKLNDSERSAAHLKFHLLGATDCLVVFACLERLTIYRARVFVEFLVNSRHCARMRQSDSL